MKRILHFLLLTGIWLQGNTQTVIGRQNVDQYPTDAGGDLTYGLTWLPQSYANTTRRYPLIIFLHGAGETGTSIASLNSLCTANPRGIPGRIADGWNATAINPRTGVRDSFIVCSPQASTWSYNYNQIKYILPNILSRYRVDTTRIYLTGLSAGGGGVFSVLGSGDSIFIKKFAAAATMSSASVDPVNGLSEGQVEAQLRYATKNYGVQVWTIAGDQDYLLDNDVRYHDSVNRLSPSPPDKLTVLAGVGHSTWGKGYDTLFRPVINYYLNAANCSNGCAAITAPNSNGSSVMGSGVTQDSLNLFEWFFLYQRTTTVATAPTANAGNNQTIILPTTTATLNGSGTDADGTIVSYSWTKISTLPAVIVSPSTAATSVTGLVQGTHTFRLTVTDNNGETGTDDVQITVNAAGNQPPLANAGSNQSLTLPTNSLTLTGSGTDPDGTISSYLWTKISGPAQFAIGAPAQAQTLVNNLVQGTYQFELRVTDNQGAIGRDTVQVTETSSTTACNGQRYTLTLGATWGGYINLAGVVDAGDTIVINAGSYGFTELSGLYGTAACPITIINQGGQVVLQALNIVYPSEYVHITGTGTPGVPYGLKMANSNYWGMHLKAQGPIEIDHVEVTGTNMGIQLRDDAPPAGLIEYRELKIHNVWVHDINGNEGIYLGNSSTPNAPKVKGIHVYDVLIERTGREGMQISNAQNVLVERVKIIQPSLLNEDAQNHAFNMGHDVQGVARDMYIQTPPWYSAFLSGGRITFECSQIDGSFSIFPSTVNPAIFSKNYEYDDNTWVETYQQLNIRDILLKSAGRSDIISMTVEGPLLPNIIQNIRIDGGATTGFVWGPNAQVSNVGPNAQFTPGCTPPSATTMWTPNWPITSPTSNFPINLLPIANAGIDIVTVLPINTVTLNGIGTDLDGLIASYQWQKISGPTQFTILTPTLPVTLVNNLVQGVYKFQLIVTDNTGTTDTDTLTVTVNTSGASNIPPVANAGANQTITLPTNSATLTGSGTDADGSISSYQWTKISGPTQFTIVSPTQAQTAVNNLVQGVYQFELRVIDNLGATGRDTVQVTVNPGANQSPVANAGSNQTITLPVNSVTLTGSGTDADGSISSYQWTKISGPTQFTIVSPTQAQTVVNNLVQGVYQFELRVTDNLGATGRDTVQVTVNAAANQSPVANAGANQTITLPVNSVTLTGSGTDADGTIISYQWTKISGPTQSTIVSPTLAQTVVNNLVQGTYQFDLTVTDNLGATDRDTVQITVNAAANQPPVANAGSNQTITLPVNNVTLTGSGTDADGTIASYQWTKISGPTQFTIVSPTQSQTVVNNLVQGTYQFELRVTDNLGATGRDTVQVIVNSATNQSPVANAGSNQSITLPTNSSTLTGSGTDADGTITSYLWTKISGPAQFTIVSPTQAQTVINNLVQGVYQFELTVTDNLGATATDIVQVTVNPAPNIPPVANAGPNQIITLPTNSLTLSGSGTDADGSITAYQWTKIFGPAQFTIVSPTQAQTVVNNLVQGTYQFELTVTDNLGATGKDTVTIAVNAAANQSPVANAGSDLTITLPVNSVTLSGSGTDADGTIVSYLWTKISGPAQFTIVSPTQAQTVVNNLVQGVYQFQLTVTDNLGATGTDIVQVTVNATPNTPPVANAGANQSITLPANSVTLSGSGTDADGTIVSYLWTKIAGPTQFTIVSPAQAQTVVNNLVQGTYQFELRVTDNLGATGTDIMLVTVNGAPNIPPVAITGNDTTITLPVNSVRLIGAGIDPDGTISTYQWTRISGPTQCTIVSANQSQTTIDNLVLGVYQFELRVTDNVGASGTSIVEVTVKEIPKNSTARVFPNPATTIINVQIDAASQSNNSNLWIYDSKGILVYHELFVRTQQAMIKQIDVSNFSNGAYFIKIGVDINNTLTLPFIKQ